VNSTAALRREIPDARAAIDRWGALRLRAAQIIRRKLVRGIDQAACRLEPGLNPVRAGREIPAKNHRGKAGSAKRPAAVGPIARYANDRNRAGRDLLMWSGRVRLPQRHDVACVSKLAAEDSGMHHGRQNLAQFESAPEKLVIRTISQARAPINKRTVLPATLLPHLANGVVGIIISCCSAGRRLCSRRGRTHPRKQQRQNNPTDSIESSQACPQNCFLVPSVPASKSLPKKDRHNRAALSPDSRHPVNPPRVPFARRPYRNSSGHFAHRRDLPGSPAAVPSGLRHFLPAWYRSKRASSLRSSR
jgi:hypothetical protein